MMVVDSGCMPQPLAVLCSHLRCLDFQDVDLLQRAGQMLLARASFEATVILRAQHASVGTSACIQGRRG